MQWRSWISPENRWFSLEVVERRTFGLHLLYAITDGVGLGIIALNEFILLRSLNASAFQVAIYFQLATLLLPFSIFMNQFLGRVRNKRRLLRWIAVFSRAPLLIFLFFPDHILTSAHRELYVYLYLFAFLAYYLANPFILPMLNLFTRSNYEVSRYGRLFSYSLMITQVIVLLSTFGFGHMLDVDPEIYRYVLPGLGFIGFCGIYMITLMPDVTANDEPAEAERLPMKATLKRTIRIFKENPAFADFQAGMMAYGWGFMMAQTIITILMVKRLLLPYSDIAFYKNVPIFISVLVYPIAGTYMDRLDPRNLGRISYLLHLLFYVGLLLCLVWPEGSSWQGYSIIYVLLAAYLFQGFFTATIGLVWGIGSAYFAPPGQVGRYHAIHLSMTGIRGLIAPQVGVLIYSWLGFVGSFSASICMQIVAIGLMTISMRRTRMPVHRGIRTEISAED